MWRRVRQAQVLENQTTEEADGFERIGGCSHSRRVTSSPKLMAYNNSGHFIISSAHQEFRQGIVC